MWKHILWKLPWNIVETFNLIIGLLSPEEASYLIFEPSFISDTLQLLIVANDEKIFAETENIFRYVKHLNVHTTDEVFKIKIIPLYIQQQNKVLPFRLRCKKHEKFGNDIFCIRDNNEEAKLKMHWVTFIFNYRIYLVHLEVSSILFVKLWKHLLSSD